MIQIKGYVVETYQPKIGVHLLFGNNNEYRKPPYRLLEGNGLTPFENLEDARRGREALCGFRDFSVTQIRPLELLVAQSDKDYPQLEPPFIIIAGELDEQERVLYGPRVKDKPAFDGYAWLKYNELTPFETIEQAQQQRGAVARHEERTTLLATLTLGEPIL